MFDLKLNYWNKGLRKESISVSGGKNLPFYNLKLTSELPSAIHLLTLKWNLSNLTQKKKSRFFKIKIYVTLISSNCIIAIFHLEITFWHTIETPKCVMGVYLCSRCLNPFMFSRYLTSPNCCSADQWISVCFRVSWTTRLHWLGWLEVQFSCLNISTQCHHRCLGCPPGLQLPLAGCRASVCPTW